MERETSTIQGETGIPVDESTEPVPGTPSDMALEPATGDIGQEKHRLTDYGREMAAEGLQTLAGNMRRISTDMETQQPAIADVTETVAEQTERLATYVRETDAREMLRTVEDAARRQPLLFMGGAFVIGLAAARFLKAAGSQRGVSRKS